MRYHAPYMEWAKTRQAAAFDLAGTGRADASSMLAALRMARQLTSA